MALCTVVKEGDLVKTSAILEDEIGDAKLVMLGSVDSDGKTVLHIASEEGHIDLVKHIIDLGADLENRSRSGGAPLHFASRSGHQTVVQYLISKGADINIYDSNGYSPLYLASEEGHFDVVECLVHSGADINKASNDCSTPLYTSASKGHFDVVKYLITEGVDLEQKGPKSQTPLCVASLNGHLEVVKYLISQGANFDTGDEDGYTPLYIASQEGHLAIVECLVDAGADLNQLIYDCDSPFQAASRNGHLDVVKYLITKGAEIDRDGNEGYTPLLLASLEGHLNVVECLVNAGADVKKANDENTSPLHAASENDNQDVVKYLITKGADIDIVSNDGYTPLLLASKDGHLNVVKCLVDAGADINRLVNKGADVNKASGYNGATPLYAASQGGHLEVVEWLVNKGADVNKASSYDGETPLYAASQEGHLEVVKCLLNKGADVNKASSYNGATPLYAASQGGHLEVVKCLVNKGADVNKASSYNGATPLYAASKGGHLEVVEWLVNKGADVNNISAYYGTPLHGATRGRCVHIVNYLISKGADPNSVDGNDSSPLHIASQARLDIVECLVNAGADVNRVTHDGYAPLGTAVRFNKQDIAEFLMSKEADLGNTDTVETILRNSSTEGHLNVVKHIIHKGMDVNTVDEDGFTSLHHASQNGHLNVVKCLVDAGADVNKAAKNGSIPLFAASFKGHLDIVKYLINKGSDINIRGFNGWTPLRGASFYGHLAVVQYLISQSADKDMGDDYGYTPLYIASQEGHLDVVKCLVHAGADVNKAAESGFTPLYAASINGHLDIVEYLINKGAAIDRRCNGQTPLRVASFYGHLPVVKYLIGHRADKDMGDNYGYTPLYVASEKGHLDVAKCLVHAGADVNKPARDGDLSILAASRGGYLDIITYLITKGAHIESCNNYGWTAFHFAADNGHLESLEYLLRNNTSGTSGNSQNVLKVGLQTLKGVTPLMVAARGGHLDCVRLLLENNADIETEDAEAWTALHYAAASGNDSVMRDLLDQKAIMSTRLSRRGQSPISIALSSGNADTARILMDKDVSSIHHIDSAGLTPIHIATVSGLTSIIEELVSLGAGVNPQSYDGQTPLHVAIRLCHCTKRQVEVTTALKQIQQESDDDISPAEALIQFLINQGSKIDIKDKNGLTPLQYAREERIRQMVFRSLSEDDVHTFRDLPIARFTESHCSIGCEGGILHLDSSDITMSIPPGTVQAGTCHDVSISLVTDDPPLIREREFLTGHGIGITFPAQWRYSTNQPITLSLPHAATLLESNDVHDAGIIWKRTKSTSVNRDCVNDTQCIIKEREINLVIDETSDVKDKVQLWIPIKLHYHALGKRMACTPFLPIDMAHGQDITLRIYLHEDIPYIAQKIQEEEENLLYRQVHPGRCFALEPESNDLELKCNGGKRIISATELFNQQKTLVSIPLTTETNASMQMMNISISATSTNQPKTSMSFMAMRTGFSTDIHSTLDEMVPGSHSNLSNVEEIRSGDFITKKMNTDQYYHLGLALGMSYQTLDTIQFRSKQHEVSGVYTRNRKAAIFMIRYWKCLHHSVSIADDNLREVWKSVSDSGHSIPVMEQGRRAEMESDESVEDVFVGQCPREESRTAPTIGLHDFEVEIPEARGHWVESLHHKRSKTPSVRSDSLTSFSTLIEEEEESRFPKRHGAHITGSVRAHRRTLSTARHIRDRVRKDLSIDEHREDEEKDRSKQAIFAWVESVEGVKPADFGPHEDTSKHADDEGQKIEPVDHIPSPSALQDDIPVQNLESRGDLSEDTDVIRLERYGIKVRIPPSGAYRAKDVTVEPIHDIPPELVLKETEAFISIGLRMSPSDATFDIPVTITMPHCGIFTKPEIAEVVTYYRKHAPEKFTPILSTSGSPRCVLRHHDLDIYMNHFSEFWIVALITRVFIGKRVICTPYIPVSTPKNYEHVLFVHVGDEHIGKVKVQPGYMAPITGEQFLVKWRSGGLKITCPESTMKDKAETLQKSEIRHLNENKVMFTVDTRTTDEDNVILHFILKQSTTKKLIVPMNLKGDTVSASPEPSASASREAAREVSTPRSSDTVSDGELDSLAAKVPLSKYIGLSEKLGIGYNEADNILKKRGQDSKPATRECLSIWKNKTGGRFTELRGIFDSVDLGGMFVDAI